VSLSREQLRQILRKRRRAIPKTLAETAAKKLAQHALNLAVIQNSQHIACYLANDGEIDPTYLLNKLWESKKNCYLPALDSAHVNELLFIEYQAGDQLRFNRYQIPEPIAANRKTCAPSSLDIVLMPLVGFDKQGGRLGMGGGFYDRTFAFRKKALGKKPFLIGIAYQLQCVEKLDIEDWDVGLDCVVTEEGIII
jgi:5-formyltetrahydrofolate cyclo-ligase